MNDTHSLERTLDYCDKSIDHSFLNSTNCSIPNNVSISTVTAAPGCPINAKAMPSIQSEEHNRKKSHIHFNRLWSVWYGILVTILQGYLVILGLQKYLGKSTRRCYARHKFLFIYLHGMRMHFISLCNNYLD